MTLLETALSWLDAGFSILPIMARGKRPSFDALAATGHDGWSVFRERQATDAEARVWFGGLQRNLAVVTGYGGLVVIDLDSLPAYRWWLGWRAQPGKEVSTYRVRSARGMHLYFFCDEPVWSYRVGPVDIKARYGYVLIPPSVHPSGWVYQGAGEVVQRVATLAEVWPIAPQQSETGSGLYARCGADPYEAATRAGEAPRARVSKGTVARIKAAIRPEDLLGLERAYRPVLVPCPLHADNHPSFCIYPSGKWYCFGENRGGDVIDLYAALHQVSNAQAIAALAQEV